MGPEVDDEVHDQIYLIQVSLHVGGHILQEIDNFLRGVEFFLQSGCQSCCSDDGLLGLDEFVLSGGEGRDGLCLPPDVVVGVDVVTEVLEEAVGSGRGELPLEDAQHVELPLLQLRTVDTGLLLRKILRK